MYFYLGTMLLHIFLVSLLQHVFTSTYSHPIMCYKVCLLYVKLYRWFYFLNDFSSSISGTCIPSKCSPWWIELVFLWISKHMLSISCQHWWKKRGNGDISWSKIHYTTMVCECVARLHKYSFQYCQGWFMQGNILSLQKCWLDISLFLLSILCVWKLFY